jgi:acyl dehydratase
VHAITVRRTVEGDVTVTASTKSTADPMFRWEDVEIGKKERSSSYLVTEAEILSFARAFDPMPTHVDAVAAKEGHFGSITAPGTFMLALRQRLLFDFAFSGGVIASLGYDEVRFLAPLRGGQRCEVEIEYLEKTPSRSKPDRGIVITSMTLFADDVPVLKLRDIALVKRRLP